MLEKMLQRIIERQIERGNIAAEEKSIYVYGYRMLLELGANLTASILIAVFLREWMVVLVFLIAFFMIRGYVGGFHAKTGIGCFCLSACTLFTSVILIRGICDMVYGKYFLALEIVMMPCIIKKAPIPSENKPLSENERAYFQKKVKWIYSLQLFAELILFFAGMGKWAFSVWAVHVLLMIMVIIDFFVVYNNTQNGAYK